MGRCSVALEGKGTMQTITKLKYGNTNTFLLHGERGSLLIDTDYAGTLPAFYRAIKERGISLGQITYVLATHYHPDHMGLISSLMGQGVQLVLMENQREAVHFSDAIFVKDGLAYEPIAEEKALLLPFAKSRAFLQSLGIRGQMLPTCSHSADGVACVLDEGPCFVGDVEPWAYLAAYGDNEALRQDWQRIFRHNPQRICFAHAPERRPPERK